MNSWLSWWFKPPEPPTRDEFDQYVFRNGTNVWAETWDEAVERIMTIDTKNFWASETEPGVWEVQFEATDEPLVVVKPVKAETGAEAARHARWFIMRDAKEQQLRGF